jgi:predicted transcriptional regulator
VYADTLPYREYPTPIYDGELFELRLKEVLPEDASTYIDDFRSCQHWSGEDAYNDERAQQISDGINSSCPGLADKKAVLFSKYPAKSQTSELIRSIIKEIESGEDFPSFVFNDPQRKSKVLDQYYEASAQSIIREIANQIPSYSATLASIRVANNKPSSELISKEEMGRYMLNVQRGYLIKALNNSDRLHPITLEKLKRAQLQLSDVLPASK